MNYMECEDCKMMYIQCCNCYGCSMRGQGTCGQRCDECQSEHAEAQDAKRQSDECNGTYVGSEHMT